MVALLLLGAVCASALLLAAKMYKRRQKLRRNQQSSISAHRLRQLEKLHLLQQQHALQEQQQQQQHSAPSQQQRLPQLKQHPLSSKHERQKSNDSILPSSPSASSSHSEVIGTAVSSRQKASGRAGRAKSVQQDQQATSRQLHTARRQLGRSHSDISTDAVDHSNLSVHSMAESLTGSTMGTVGMAPLLSEPSTPTSTADSNTAFLPNTDVEHRHIQTSESLHPGPSSSTAKQSTGKRRQKHKKAASKPPPSKRRFIPGLDEEFDEAVHELPTPTPDTATAKGKQKVSVGSLGSSNPSSASSLPLPKPAAQSRRQLSVNAAPFIPTGYAQNCSLGVLSYPDLQWAAQHTYLPESAFGYDQMRPPTPIPACSSLPFSPRSFAYSSGSSSQSLLLDQTSPSTVPCQYIGEQPPVLLAPPGFPRPTSRHSPTSVLPWLPEAQSSHTLMLSPRWSNDKPQLSSSLMSNPSGVLLPPVLEDVVVSSPFPGMRQLGSRHVAVTCCQMSSPQASVSSALLDLPRQLPVSSVGLPGFNTIWSTSGIPAAAPSSSKSWSTSIASSSIW